MHSIAGLCTASESPCIAVTIAMRVARIPRISNLTTSTRSSLPASSSCSWQSGSTSHEWACSCRLGLAPPPMASSTHSSTTWSSIAGPESKLGDDREFLDGSQRHTEPTTRRMASPTECLPPTRFGWYQEGCGPPNDLLRHRVRIEQTTLPNTTVPGGSRL